MAKFEFESKFNIGDKVKIKDNRHSATYEIKDMRYVVGTKRVVYYCKGLIECYNEPFYEEELVPSEPEFKEFKTRMELADWLADMTIGKSRLIPISYFDALMDCIHGEDKKIGIYKNKLCLRSNDTYSYRSLCAIIDEMIEHNQDVIDDITNNRYDVMSSIYSCGDSEKIGRLIRLNKDYEKWEKINKKLEEFVLVLRGFGKEVK